MLLLPIFRDILKVTDRRSLIAFNNTSHDIIGFYYNVCRAYKS